MERIIVGILFSDVAGFSKLSQPGLEIYSTTILPDLENRVIHPYREHLEKINTWGDAIMLVSTRASRLAHLALNLRDFYKNENWSDRGIEPDLSVRIALHLADVSHGPNAISGEDDFFGDDLTVAARIEPITPPNTIYTTEQFKTHIDNNDPIIEFDDLGDVLLAKDAGKRHLFHLRRRDDPPAEPIRREIQVTPWRESNALPDENTQIIHRRLERCKEGEVVRFIVMVGRNMMLSPSINQVGVNLIDLPFPKALSEGVKFKGILLHPESEEAKFRSEIETPGKPFLKDRLLYIDANFVRKDLQEEYIKHNELKDKIRNIELKYTTIGLGFSLWLFDDVAFMEPYHFGKKKNRRNLRGFSQLKIPESTFEYERMETHFDVLWDSSEDIWTQGETLSSARDRLLAVRKSGPHLTPEDAEMLNRVIQEARDASMPEKLST